MEQSDFSGIDPLRIPEARRRVAALDDYLKLASPTTADTRWFGDSIGLSRTQFGRLARVWRAHRDPRLLVIGKRGAATRDYGVDPLATEIARCVIAKAGPDATLASAAPDIERQCFAAGVPPPARATINNHLRAALSASSSTAAGPPRIVIGRMWFHLPVAGMAAGSMPTLLAAVLLPERIVVAHSVSTDPDAQPSVDAIVGRLAGLRTAGATKRPLLIDPDDRRVAANALAGSGLGEVRSHNRSIQREISRAFAGRLGSLAAIHQRGMAQPATKRVISRQDEALPAAEVMAVIDGAVRASNAVMPATAPAFDIARP